MLQGRVTFVQVMSISIGFARSNVYVDGIRTGINSGEFSINPVKLSIPK
jgi:hypothetical protein